MKCICVRKCQTRLDGAGKKPGQIVPVSVGTVMDFKECPTNFEVVEGRYVDFLTASEDELMEATWSFKMAARAIKDEFDITLKKADDTTKADVVSQILDARYRAV